MVSSWRGGGGGGREDWWGETPRGIDSRRTLHSRIGRPVYSCREAEEEDEERGRRRAPARGKEQERVDRVSLTNASFL